MKKVIYLKTVSVALILFAMLVAGGCKKDSTTTAGTGDIQFVNLVVEKNNLAITELTKVTATATGSNLSYTWKCDNELGVFEGSGAEVMFTICHGGTFKITCEVKDNANHLATKDAYVTYVE
jgi:hypothetical protein